MTDHDKDLIAAIRLTLEWWEENPTVPNADAVDEVLSEGGYKPLRRLLGMAEERDAATAELAALRERHDALVQAVRTLCEAKRPVAIPYTDEGNALQRAFVRVESLLAGTAPAVTTESALEELKAAAQQATRSIAPAE
jgi:hypothetical protein